MAHSKLSELLKNLDISTEQLQELAQNLQNNPMMALSVVREMNIPPEVLQRMAAIVMADPEEITLFAKDLGFDQKQIQEVEDQMHGIRERLANPSASNGQPPSKS